MRSFVFLPPIGYFMSRHYCVWIDIFKYYKSILAATCTFIFHPFTHTMRCHRSLELHNVNIDNTDQYRTILRDFICVTRLSDWSIDISVLAASTGWWAKNYANPDLQIIIYSSPRQLSKDGELPSPCARAPKFATQITWHGSLLNAPVSSPVLLLKLYCFSSVSIYFYVMQSTSNYPMIKDLDLCHKALITVIRSCFCSFDYSRYQSARQLCSLYVFANTVRKQRSSHSTRYHKSLIIHKRGTERTAPIVLHVSPEASEHWYTKTGH